MNFIIATELVVTFLLDKGFARMGEPFAFCDFSGGSIIVPVDEEYSQTDLGQLQQDWESQGQAAADLFQELFDYLVASNHIILEAE